MEDKICNLDYSVIEARIRAYYGDEKLQRVLAQYDHVEQPLPANHFIKQYLAEPNVSPTGRTLDKFGRAVDHYHFAPRHHCKVTGELTPDDIDAYRQKITNAFGVPKHLLGADKS